MEFVGRIKQVLPERRGTSQRTNNEWVALPFIFEYFENENDRYADTVLLETFDTNIQPYIKEGLEVKIGFGHRTREYEGKVYNELRMYSIESIKKQQPAPQPTTTTLGGPATPPYNPNPIVPPQNDKADDLPF
jgi:hypothetical protein